MEYDMTNPNNPNDMMHLPLAEDVLLDVEATDRKTLFAATAATLAARHGLASDAVLAALTAREELGSTALGMGVAIPHARVEGLDHAVIGFARSKSPIDFDAPDSDPVRLFFFLLAPMTATEQHIDTLSDLASLLCRQALRNALLDAATPQAVVELLRQPPLEALAA
jgi:PTS system nitrogen regulatory IIA component